MIFKSREHAAHLLLEKLLQHERAETVVLAVPRGAVPMGLVIAHGLRCPLDIVPVRKVSSPLAPEFALGAADIEGNFYPEEEVLNLPHEQLRLWFRKSLEVLRQRDFRWRKSAPHLSLRDKRIVLVDDGVATGATMRAALMWARRRQPAEIIAAVAVSSSEGMSVMTRFADRVECLHVAKLFSAVGEFYVDFSEVSDDDVCSMLQKARSADAVLRNE
ncbi:MAG: hypothetical protein RLZZ488_1607 [Pseudomonadota bacterium]|jgi:predicted phosphoribosyltransferase